MSEILLLLLRLPVHKTLTKSKETDQNNKQTMHYPSRLVLILCTLGVVVFVHGAGLQGVAAAAPPVFPAQFYPTNSSLHPRICIDHLPSLRSMYLASPAPNEAVRQFKAQVTNLLSYTEACDDWRCDAGWPAAALALVWLMTGNAAAGQKACDLFLPHFDGVASGIGHDVRIFYPLAYDWLFHHPCMTPAKKLELRNKIISTSNGNVALDSAGSWTAHDSDRMINVAAFHFLGGLAILGEDPVQGAILMNRGWAGWETGQILNNEALSNLPDYPVKNLLLRALNGLPHAGWAYASTSDFHTLAFFVHALDELGALASEIKPFFANSIDQFERFTDPANTHYHWHGDSQDPTDFERSQSFVIMSYLSNCIFLAERFQPGSHAAAFGRYFLDHIGHPSWGYTDGDEMLWFMRSYRANATRMNPFTHARKRYLVSGLGQGQDNGIATFRSAWAPQGGNGLPIANFLNPNHSQQVTWGGFFGIGSYPVDHMLNCAGSFFIWRNGDYLLTEPRNYGGNEQSGVEMFNSLSIENDASDQPYGPLFNHGPVTYTPQKQAFLGRGRAVENHPSLNDLMYAMLNADGSYNLPENPWVACTGACRTPVVTYRRHFLYGGFDYAIIIDKVQLRHPSRISLRYRTWTKDFLPSVISPTLIRIPSSRGNYRTLVKVLAPTNVLPTWDVYDETTKWGAIEDWKIDDEDKGKQIRGSYAARFVKNFTAIQVLNFDKAGAGNTQLDHASLISSSSSIGACGSRLCLILSPGDTALRSFASYSTPASTWDYARHVVGDLNPGCYQVVMNGNVVIVPASLVTSADYALMFVVPNASTNSFEVSLASSGCESPPNTPTITTFAPSSASLNVSPTRTPSKFPSKKPSRFPSKFPSKKPTRFPTLKQTRSPSRIPSKKPSTPKPSKRPTTNPGTRLPSKKPTTTSPSRKPSTKAPFTNAPSRKPTTNTPSSSTTTSKVPTNLPSKVPTKLPTNFPSKVPTKLPTKFPSKVPTKFPTKFPTKLPTSVTPTRLPTTKSPTTTSAPSTVTLPAVGRKCNVFPANNVWNVDITHLPVHPRSAQYIASMDALGRLKPDFGCGIFGNYGIPITLVNNSQPNIPIVYDRRGYPGESDPGPFPIPLNARIEGGGDRHVLTVNTDTCKLYELYVAVANTSGNQWSCYQSTKWDLNSNAMRPIGWTSADAAGLPILAGLVRYDETVGTNEIRHAIRMTTENLQRLYVWPGSHYASEDTNVNRPPYGLRLRLKASVDISSYSVQAQKILRALKKYGAILADGGTNWYISGEAHAGWFDSILVGNLRNIRGSDFEAVDSSSLQVEPNSYEAENLNAPPPMPVSAPTQILPNCQDIVPGGIPSYENANRSPFTSPNGIYCVASDFSQTWAMASPCLRADMLYGDQVCEWFEWDSIGIPCLGPSANVAVSSCCSHKTQQACVANSCVWNGNYVGCYSS